MRCETYPLGELVTIKYGKNQAKVSSEEGKIPIYGTGGLMGYATEALYNQPSVLIGRKGTINKVKYVDHPFWTVDTLFYTVVNKELVIPKYLYYVMSMLDLNNYNEGTTIPSLRTETLNKLEFNIPSIKYQSQVLSFLEPLDDKIELNKKINDNLEKHAQAIFKSWFVDYEPFGGLCPDSWKQAKLGDVSDINSGKRPSMKQDEKTDNANIPLVGAASIMGYTNAVLYKEKILVIGRVGTHGVIQRFYSPCWASDNTLVIISKYYEFAYQILKTINYRNMNRGSTQPLITQTDMKNIEIVLPDNDVLDKFEKLVGTLMHQHENNIIENVKLMEIRETFLPKLMSGELDVSEIEI